jgi:tetratricopeptide (TPR) repeat protein
MANSYRALGNDEAAMAGYEQYLRVDPKNGYVHYQMGEIALDRGDRAGAERRFRAALAIDAKVAPARVALGVMAFNRGDLPAAEREIAAALALKPDVRLAHFNLALIGETREDWQRAEAEYRRELQLHPKEFKAAFNLSRLYERLGNRKGEIDALRESVAANDAFAEGYLYLARASLNGGDLDEAAAMARRVSTSIPVRPGAARHYVLADVFSKRGAWRRRRGWRPAAGAARAHKRKPRRARDAENVSLGSLASAALPDLPRPHPCPCPTDLPPYLPLCERPAQADGALPRA